VIVIVNDYGLSVNEIFVLFCLLPNASVMLWYVQNHSDHADRRCRPVVVIECVAQAQIRCFSQTFVVVVQLRPRPISKTLILTPLITPLPCLRSLFSPATMARGAAPQAESCAAAAADCLLGPRSRPYGSNHMRLAAHADPAQERR
jgi:hypothetical protein